MVTGLSHFRCPHKNIAALMVTGLDLPGDKEKQPYQDFRISDVLIKILRIELL